MSLAGKDVKSFTEIKGAGGEVVDFKDVTIRGYLSTFQSTTAADRMGDYVIPGAFKDSLPTFLANPVLLVDHRNAVSSLAGSFTVVREDSKGLYIEAALSNAPTEEMRSIRWKVAEGHLRSLSMGGIFHYEADGKGIFRVDLAEGSLVPVPANQDALITVRALTEEEERRFA